MIQDKGDSWKIAVFYEKKYFCFELVAEISWEMQRIIWIGYYKNEQNNKCLIALLPKDVVKLIFKMLSNESFAKHFVPGKRIWV